MRSCPWEGPVPVVDTGWALTGREQPCCKGPRGPGEQQAEPAVCPAGRAPTALGQCEQEQSQQRERNDHLPPLSTC